MGLDIKWYRGLTSVGVDEATDIDGDVRDEFVKLYHNPNFPGRADDIVDRGCYSYEESGCFNAGAYSGYNRWRDDLAKLAGYPITAYYDCGVIKESYAAACWDGATGPFSELINFADDEGVIGSSVAAKLAADFAAFQHKADESRDSWFREKYAHWREAFEKAADRGAVDFH